MKKEWSSEYNIMMIQIAEALQNACHRANCKECIFRKQSEDKFQCSISIPKEWELQEAIENIITYEDLIRVAKAARKSNILEDSLLKTEIAFDKIIEILKESERKDDRSAMRTHKRM